MWQGFESCVTAEAQSTKGAQRTDSRTLCLLLIGPGGNTTSSPDRLRDVDGFLSPYTDRHTHIPIDFWMRRGLRNLRTLLFQNASFDKRTVQPI